MTPAEHAWLHYHLRRLGDKAWSVVKTVLFVLGGMMIIQAVQEGAVHLVGLR